MNRNRSGRRYDREFKNNAVALVRGGRTITEVARDLGVSKWSLGHWVRQAEEGQLLSEPKTLALETPEQRELRRLRQELEYVSRQRDILKSLGHLVGGDATARFTVMEKFQHQYGADALAEAFDVSESGFVAHRGKQNGQRWKQDAELRALIAQSFEQSRNTYGSPRVRLDLRELGHRCGKNRVARLMRESGLRARQKRRFRPRTTDSRLRILTVPLLSALLITTAFAQYIRTDLVSNQERVAPNIDPRLLNAWGLVALPTSPYWVSDNNSGFSTLYTSLGAQIPLFVTIPPAPRSPAGTLGTPTGIVGNISTNPTDFTITENGVSKPSVFIFATLDGTISGWNPAIGGATSPPDSHATIAVDRSSAGAVYTGLAIATNQGDQTFLYAADGGPNGRVDMFDGAFNLVKSFDDPAIPKGFVPYGIQAINGQIWVTFTALNKAQGGFVDVFDTEGNLVKHFAVHGPLHSPWGIALAPANFGPMSNAILISNNTSRGRINAFNPETGKFLGPLRDANGKAIEVDLIWALQFGQGAIPNNGLRNQLFFTAGPNNYANGLFGVIESL